MAYSINDEQCRQINKALDAAKQQIDELNEKVGMLKKENMELKQEVNQLKEWGAAQDRAMSASFDREKALESEVESLKEFYTEVCQHVKSWCGGSLPISHHEIWERLKLNSKEKKALKSKLSRYERICNIEWLEHHFGILEDK